MKQETAAAAHERGYIEGRRASDLSRLSEVLRSIAGMGADETPEVTAARLAVERLETVSKLRELCREHGDNDWADNLHLAVCYRKASR